MMMMAMITMIMMAMVMVVMMMVVMMVITTCIQCCTRQDAEDAGRRANDSQNLALKASHVIKSRDHALPCYVRMARDSNTEKL